MFVVVWSPTVRAAGAVVAWVAPGSLLVVVSLGLVVAATGRLRMVAPFAALGSVVGEVAEAVKGLGGVPPGLPLLQRRIAAVRLPPHRMLSIGDVPALSILHGLLDRAVPRATTLDVGRSLAEVARPFGLEQLDRAGVGAAAPLVFAYHRLVLRQQLRVGFPVGLVLLLGLAGGAFAVGGTVGLLPGDLLGFLRLLGLLPHAGEVAASQPPGRTMLQAGELVSGLLQATGRLGQSLVVLFASGGRLVEPAGLVAWRGGQQLGELVASGAQVVLAHAAQIQRGGGVGGQPLTAVPTCHRGELVGLVGGRAVSGRHVQRLALRVVAAGGLGRGDAVVGGPPDRARPPDVQPLAILRAGHAHQRLIAGDPLRLVPRRGIRQVDGAPVGVAPHPPGGPLVQVLPGQGHLAAVLEPQRHGALLEVERGDLAAAGIGDPKRLEGALAADHLVAHRAACRRLWDRVEAPSRNRKPRTPPPASIAASCLSSPTNTTLAPASWAWSSRRASLREPSIPASSTTRTVLASRTRSSCPSCPPSRLSG